ncbi:MAG TPA: nucleotidyltransferase domain-containing protein [Prolixibacteraceae bacterium]|jgi:predicted nucleotidyltransferase|nr:nucleotidyltransferase domain-containing protein [Prolixibacteraceae bacterium]HPR61908.1 nucleotidyltransferase domain-containing protein [Prolixibacteraceae bacterium]
MKFGLNDKTLVLIRSVLSSFPEIDKAILYGSRAKGTFKNGSDIDLTLIGNNLNQSILFELIGKIDDLMLPYSFDISIFEKVSNPEFKAHVNRVGKTFFEKTHAD